MAWRPADSRPRVRRGVPSGRRRFGGRFPYRASFLSAVLVVLLLGGCGGSSQPGKPTTDERDVLGTLLGLMWREEGGELVRFDPRSLEPLPGGRLPLKGAWPWAYSPSGSQLALASCDEAGAALHFADVKRLRLVGEALEVGPGCVAALAWSLGERLLVVGDDPPTGRAWAAVVDPLARDVLREDRLSGTIVGAEQSAEGLVVLLAPPGSIGPVRFVLVSPEGDLRSVLLARTQAGREFEQPAKAVVGELRPERQREPALALDPDGQRAFVVGAGEPVAEVDLASLEVAYHELGRPVSLLERFLGWIDPVAEAKGPITGPTRVGIFVGEGLLAVSGSDARGSIDREGVYRQTSEPAGLELVDTHEWTLRTLDPEATFVASSAGTLLAYGAVTDAEGSSTITETMSGAGLKAYGLDGGELFHLFGEEPILDVQTAGPYAYVGPAADRVLHVVDLRFGRVIRERTIDWWPQLLVGRSSAWP
jgi:hypothetical protein